MSSIRTGRRIEAASSSSAQEPGAGTTGKNESDSNADTCCLGTNFIILQYTQRTVDVYPYDTSYKPMTNVPIVSGATAWTNPRDNTTYILIFHESLYYGTKLDHSLINPNQVRSSGIDFWDNPFDPLHEIGIEIDQGPTIPLMFEGTKLSFTSRAPTDAELSSCQHIEMTSVLRWDPTNVSLATVQGKSREPPLPAVRKLHELSSNNPFNFESRTKSTYLQHDSDSALLHDTIPSLVQLKEIATEVMISSTNEVPIRGSLISSERHLRTTAETLAELWGIGVNKARASLNATTQMATRSAVLPISRRYRADKMYGVKRLSDKFSTDTLWSDSKSLNQNVCAQIFSHKNGFSVCYPMTRANGDTIGDSLLDFIHDFGVPEQLKSDGAAAQEGKNTKFMASVRKYRIQHKLSEPRRPNENPSESAIREIKRRWYRMMDKKRIPLRLWDYVMVWVCETGNLCVSSSKYANGRTPIEIITGETPDISEYTDFGIYDWVTYSANAGIGPNSLGRWLGVSHKVGQLMSYWVLTISGHIISVCTVQRLTNDEKATDEWKDQMKKFDEKIKTRLNAKDTDLSDLIKEQPHWNRLSMDEDDEGFISEYRHPVQSDNTPAGAPEPTPDSFDGYLQMGLGLPRGEDGEIQHATVKRRTVDHLGQPIGIAHSNPMLDTRMYDIEYADGTVETVTANIIAENILSQVDERGHRQLLLDEIIEHKYIGNSKEKSNCRGRKRKKYSARDWEFCVTWKDGSTNWINVKDLKESFPVQLAEYVENNRLSREEAFSWWLPYVLKKRKSIIAKLKSKYWQRTHKYGIRVPKSVEEALRIDKEEGNTFWADAIEVEMRKIRPAVKLYDGDIKDLVGYQEITTHFIFDIKLGENFRRKARLVADGHKTTTPSSVTYSSVVSRDSVRICLLLAALNDLNILSGDIENAYLTAPCRENCWTMAGKEFGSDQGKPLIILKALYGLKSSGAAFRAFLAETLDDMGFKSSHADPDVWMRPAVKHDGEKYYEYILCYVDDILSISMEPERPMKEIQRAFKFKNDLIKPPEFYLGAKLQEKVINERKVWTMTSKDYIKLAIDNLETQLKKRNMKLPSRSTTPMVSEYIPELDISEELCPDDITFFQELIGILRWAVEIGRVDILTELSMLSTYQAAPRQGHLEQVLHIFAFLKKNPKLTLYFDHTEPVLDSSMFNNSTPEAFKEIYRDAQEEVPPHMPDPRGRRVTTTAYADASHAANKVTRRSHSGYILFVNRAPISWYSKRQNTVEASTFSSEFIALRVCVEAVAALRYKLRMFGVPFDEPTNILCDNESVVKNSSKIESTLDKKHNALAYHAVRWAVAAGSVRIGKVDGNYNLADAMTKRLTSRRRDALFGDWTY